MKSRNGLPALALIAGLGMGCSRQPGVLSTTPSATGSQQMPFESAPSKGGVSPTGSLPAFSIPAGTPVVVRIQSEVSSATANPGDTFEAIVDDPVVIEGQTLMPVGARATGRVVGARASSGAGDPGYLRMVLTAISINGKVIPLQSSSIFVKGGSREQPGSVLVAAASPAAGNRRDVKFPTEWRLRFRLSQTLSISE